METCDLAISAHIDLRNQPNMIVVEGSVLVYGDADEVFVKEAIPQGINPAILLLEVSIKEHNGPKKGICQPFQFTKQVDGRQYSSVAIRHGESKDDVEVTYTD